jgi:predicted RNA-binding Zn-ribbon protein involved in translation (DUF1610 family)
MNDDELQHYCPECGEDQQFWMTARTELKLGRKRKYSCAECDYGFVRIDETVDTSVEA